MGKEIERKFLIAGDTWRTGARGVSCRQGYLCVGPPVAVRVRVMGGRATLNIKRATLDITRDEFEYPIPAEDAEALLAGLCQGYLVEKTRYRIAFGGHVWEVDEFHGLNAGLLVAEIELNTPDEPFARPPWVGSEVSGDPRYLNSSLTTRPYCQWSAAGRT
ncbi:MAG: CYTH domain-containing protein [Candidatus Hydrogenedentes bacterium]|nr:CYTH domain-containing protein [Candidatus Hydrogenedentota bacterium]